MIERLSSIQMASFAARGYLRFDGRVPAAINERFMADLGGGEVSNDRELMANNRIPEIPAGTPLMDAYPDATVFCGPRASGV